MFDGFLPWWKEQLLDCIPRAWRTDDPALEPALVVSFAPSGGFDVAVRSARRTTPVAVIPPGSEMDAGGAGRIAKARGRLPVVMRIPPSWLLERSVTLPLAAARNAVQVVGYEMDRLTPFQPQDVHWTCGGLIRDAARGQAIVHLSLVPRVHIEPAMDVLRRIGLTIDRLEAARPDGLGAVTIPLAAEGRLSRRRAVQPRLAAVVAFLAIVAIALPFVRQSLAFGDLEGQMAELAPKVAQVEALRRQVQTRTAAGDVLGAEIAASGDPLAAIAAITSILPDDAFLVELSLARRSMTMRGYAAAAPRLITALAADPSVRNPAFTAPVTRIEGRQLDAFSIRAEWTP